MIKKIISAILSTAIVLSCIPAAFAGEDSVILSQSFANLTEIPYGWTATGTEGVNYQFNTDSIGTFKSQSGKFGIKADDEYDTYGESYSVSFGLSHNSGQLNYVHIGASSPDYVGALKIAEDGYTMSFKPSSDYKSAVIRIYKDGEEIGILEDTNKNYGYQSIRKFTVTVTPEKLTVSGAGSKFEYEDYDPIYSGYIGAFLNDPIPTEKGRLSEFRISKLLSVTETNLSTEQKIDEDITVSFSDAPAPATVTKKNIYITDADGNKISEDSYELSVDVEKVTITFSTPLFYATPYNLVIGADVATEDGNSIGADMAMFFKTQEPPFSIKTQINGETVDISIGNTYFPAQDAYVFVTASESGVSVLSRMVEVEIPRNDTADGYSADFGEDISGYDIDAFCLDTDYFPLLVNKEEKFEPSDAEAVVTGNTLVVSGMSPGGKSTSVYAIVSEKETGEFVAAAKAKSNESGAYEISISMENANPDYYVLTITGNDFKKLLTKDFYFATAQMKENAILDFNSATELDETAGVQKVSDCIADYAQILSLGSSVYDEIKEICAAEIAAKLYSFIKEDDLTVDDGEDIRARFRLAVDFVAAECGYVEKITENAGFAEKDAANGATVTSIYNEKLTESAKTAVAVYLKNYSYNSYEDIYAEFAKAVVINAMNGYDGGTGSHIGDVLKSNAELVGISLEEYNGASNQEAINTYIFEALVTSIEAISNAITRALTETDQSLYSHSFTLEDLESSDWEFDESLMTENGIVLASGTTEVLSKFVQTGDFELGGSFTRDYNALMYLFDYHDNKNYSYVNFYLKSATDQYTAVVKVEDGTSTELARVSGGSYSGMKVLVEDEGYVTVKTAAGAPVIGRTYMGGQMMGGKIGARLQYSKGSIKSITIQNYLGCTIDISEDYVPVDTESIDVKFNYPVKVNTVNAENIKLKEFGKELSGYTIEPAADGRSFTVKLAGELKYKEYYEIVVSQNVKSAFGSAQFINDFTAGFTTEKPELNASIMKGVCDEKNVFLNDLTLTHGIYRIEKALDTLKGKTVDIQLQLENSGANRDVSVIFTLENESGAVLWSSGVLEENIGAEAPVTASAVIPENATAKSEFKYLILNSVDSMQSAYPYYSNQAVGKGEAPSVSKSGTKITVIGKTVSGKADKNINLLVTDSSKVIKAATAVTDKNGGYSFTFEVDEDYIADSGLLNVTVGGEEFAEVAEASVYFALVGDRNSAVASINDRADTKQAIDEYKDVLDISTANDAGIVLYTKLSDSEKGELAELINDRKPFSETDGGAAFLKNAKECMVLVCFANGKEDALYSADGEYLTDDIIDFSALATNKIYNENLTGEGKKLVRETLLKSVCADSSELYTAYARAVVTAGINNWTENGFGHIRNLLTKNATEAKLNVSKYTSSSKKSDFDRSLITNPVEDFDDLQERINNITSGSGGSSGGGGGGGSSNGSSNGGFSSSAKSSFVSDEPVASQPPAEKNGFADMTGYEWANEAVKYLSENKIVNGYDDGSFRPGNKLLREEFVTLIVKAFNITATEGSENSFADVSEGAWYYPYVLAACSNGIIQGFDGKFGTGEAVTRQDAVVILGRVLEMKGTEISAENSIGGYADASEISDYAQNAFNYFVSKGIINGTDENKLAPKADCRRAEMAKMLYAVIK